MVLPLAISINSTLTFLFVSLFGRGNLGQGAQKFETTDAKKLLLINPKLIGDTQANKKILESFGNREVLPIAQEIRNRDRHILDSIVFDILGLSQTERDAVYEGVINLVEMRLNKAESLKPKQLRKRVGAAQKTRGIWRELPPDLDED